MICLPSLIAGIASCGSFYALYVDYYNRRQFETEFLLTGQIDGLKLMTGVITSEISDRTNLSSEIFTLSREILAHPKVDPIYKIDEYVKHSYLNHNYYNYDYRFFGPYNRIYVMDFWRLANVESYIAPDIKINGIDIVISPKSKILYTHSINANVSISKTITHQTIPNNSIITTFGKITDVKVNETESVKKCAVKYIGSKQCVLDQIAYDYYGVSPGITVMLSSAFVVSLIGILLSIKN